MRSFVFILRDSTSHASRFATVGAVALLCSCLSLCMVCPKVFFSCNMDPSVEHIISQLTFSIELLQHRAEKR